MLLEPGRNQHPGFSPPRLYYLGHRCDREATHTFRAAEVPWRVKRPEADDEPLVDVTWAQWEHPAMERELAVAAGMKGVNAAKVHQTIDAFVVEFARCEVCRGTGTIEYPMAVDIPANDLSHGGEGRPSAFRIRARTRIPCPRCGQPRAAKGYDPDAVRWVCMDLTDGVPCDAHHPDTEHDGCGLRVLMGLPPAASDEDED